MDWHLRILLQKKDDAIFYKIKGDHDGYPAHSIWLGQDMVYFYDPWLKGKGGTSLVGYGDEEVDVEGEVPCGGGN